MTITTGGTGGIRATITLNPDDLQRLLSPVAAMQETVLNAGRGEVVTSIRKKMPGEKRKAPHGAAIASFLKVRGHDAFDFPPDIVDKVLARVMSAADKALGYAAKTGRAQPAGIQEALREAAEDLAEWARENIEKGGLGENTGRYAKRKKSLTYAGVYDSSHGHPGPRGWATGRFARGIRGIWKLGHKYRQVRSSRSITGRRS